MVPFTEIESQAAEPGLEGKQRESAWQGQSLEDLWDLQVAMSRRLCSWMFRLGLRRDSGLQAGLQAAPAHGCKILQANKVTRGRLRSSKRA